MFKHLKLPGLGGVCYETNENNVDTEGKFIWVDGEPVCNFGNKYKGRTLKDLATQDPGYLRWIAGSGFSPEVQTLAAKALKGDFPKPIQPTRRPFPREDLERKQ